MSSSCAFAPLIFFSTVGAAVGGEWAYLGGQTEECSAATDLRCGGVFPPSLQQWPGARCCAHVWAAPDSSPYAFVWGGYGYDGNGTLSYLNDLWRLHMPSMTWEFLGGSTVGNSDGGAHWPAARSYAPYAFDESTSSFYIFSGRGGSKDKYLQDLWRLDTRNFTWTRLGEHSPQPTPRWWSNFWAVPTRLYIQGGETDSGSGTLNDMWYYEYAKGSWVPVQDRPPNATAYGVYTGAVQYPGERHNAFTTSYNGSLYMFGGSGYGDKAHGYGVTQDLWRFDVSQHRWTFVGGNPGAVELHGTCGEAGVRSVDFLPTARHAGANFDFPIRGSKMLVLAGEHHPGPQDPKGSPELLMFNDLWSVDLEVPAQGWAFEGGTCNVPNVPNATRGNPGQGSRAYTPQSRYGGNGWHDGASAAWYFGGGYTGYTSDVWRFAWGE